MRIALLALSFAAALAAGCQSSLDPSAATSPTADQLPLLTQPPPAAQQACMEALASGALALHPRSGLGIATGDGRTMPVAWPHGYSARLVDGTIVLFDHEGNALARLGDQIELGGGSAGDGVWYTCHGQLTLAG